MFTLINMNDRMYDPEVGRFLAVDNFVNDPYSSQDYNRYTYANNNPLKFVDPNGESVIVIVAVAVFATAGAYAGGVATNGGQTDPSMWNWKSGKTWAGIGIGAVVGGAAGYGMAAGGAALAGTGLMGNFGTSGMITSYVIAGAATGGAGGYIIGFTGTTISGGNLSSSHKAGTQYGKIGAAFGGVVGGIYGNSLSLEATLKHEPPRQQEQLYASLDDSHYSSNFSQSFSSNNGDDYEVVKTMYIQSGQSIEFEANSAIKVKVTNLNVTGFVAGGVQDQSFQIQKENWFGRKYSSYNTPIKGFMLFPTASSEYKFSHFVPSPMHWKINVSMQCDACYLNVTIYQVR